MTSREIRQQYIDFFVKGHGHSYVPSSPVVPHGDPTLLFANAGMNQFKDVFLGLGTREYNRAVNTQKCIRAGGKHNDLADVGKDTYHHTFFEMLGNWSLGDYFKSEAIDWGWKLMTEVWGLPADRLHATVFEGDDADGVPADDEAAEIWSNYLPAERISRWSKKDNFWEMGDTGPCGPCSEIHIDLTPDKSGAPLVNADDPRVIELWNLVFIQFNRTADASLESLPAKHVDTGLGFERTCAVLQGKSSNYDTDVFTPLFDAIRDVTKTRPYGSVLEDPIDVAYRVIADHVRALTFALTDGAHCGNDGRNYVLRRILRRAVRYGRQTFEMHDPFLHHLVPVVVETMGDVFPELTTNPQAVIDEIHEEEQSFSRTLDRGIELFEEAAGRGGESIDAEDAFRLYDTYGFPIDLTTLMAEERGMAVDVEGFEGLMEDARQRSRDVGGQADALESLVNIVQKSDIEATAFVGYETTSIDDARVIGVFAQDDEGHFEATDSPQAGQVLALVTDRTPFYAEAGGQIGDTGSVRAAGGTVYRVTDTIKVGEVYFHLGEIESAGGGALGSGDPLVMEVDADRRRRIMAHHTSTHLMNWAQRQVLGDHVHQRGSLVAPDRLRFDFSHNQAMSVEEVVEVERLTNAIIDQDLAVYTASGAQEDAVKINGLRAVFGEKYPPRVRVVSVGVGLDTLLGDPDNAEWPTRSIEFCGGTHLAQTGEAERFAIISEEAVAKGIRRITALAGEAARQAEADGQALLGQLDGLGDDAGDDLPQRVNEIQDAINQAMIPLATRHQLRERLVALQKIVKKQQKKQSKSAAADVVGAAQKIADQADGAFIVEMIEEVDGHALRAGMDVIRKKCPDAAVMLGSATGDKVAFVAAVPDELIKKGLKAGDWVRDVAKVAGGGGGGRPDMAQAGGKDPAKIGEALDEARRIAAAALG
ncbi:MAG: alanine--tRNA ligase [Planctomycetaceae bacterium]|nr:alanine--tRNA ligase [Planctomycetaceae bacterium]